MRAERINRASGTGVLLLFSYRAVCGAMGIYPTTAAGRRHRRAHLSTVHRGAAAGDSRFPRHRRLSRPWLSSLPLGIAAIATAVAFAALYYLEHVYYPAQLR